MSDSRAKDGLGSDSKRSQDIAKFLLIAVPLIVAPIAFYYSRKYSTISSPILETVLIAVIAFEFYFILLWDKGPFSKISIFDDDEPRMEITVLELECGGCGMVGEYNYDGGRISCLRCEADLDFDYDKLA